MIKYIFNHSFLWAVIAGYKLNPTEYGSCISCQNNSNSFGFQYNVMDLIYFLIFLFIYVPLNIACMLLTIVCFNVLNKVFSLRFPAWIISFAAGLLVFLMFTLMIEESSTNSENTDIYITGSAVINIALIIVMLLFSGIARLVFKKNPDTTPFGFGKSQKIATVAYCMVIMILAALPFLSN